MGHRDDGRDGADLEPGGSPGGHTRRDLLKKAAVAGAAVWVVPAVVSVRAASAESAPATTPCAPGSVGIIDGGCTGRFRTFEVINNCAAAVVFDGNVVAPGGTFPSLALIQSGGFEIIDVFQADAHGQPFGPALASLTLPSCV